MSQPTIVAYAASAVAGVSSLVSQVVPANATETANVVGVGALVTAVCALIGQLGMRWFDVRQKTIENQLIRDREERDAQLIRDREERESKARDIQDQLEDERREREWEKKDLLRRIAELEAGQAVNAGRLDGQQRVAARTGLIGPETDIDPTLDPPPYRILIVEDDVATASRLATLITQKNWMASHAMTTDVALSKLADHPAWVVLDLTIGVEGKKEDTIGLIPRIRRHSPGTKIAILTADATRLDARTRALADAAFVKDWPGIDALLEVIGSGVPARGGP